MRRFIGSSSRALRKRTKIHTLVVVGRYHSKPKQNEEHIVVGCPNPLGLVKELHEQPNATPPCSASPASSCRRVTTGARPPRHPKPTLTRLTQRDKLTKFLRQVRVQRKKRKNTKHLCKIYTCVFWKRGETRPFLGRLLFFQTLSHAGC